MILTIQLEITFAVLVLLAFVVLFALRTRWRASPVGRPLLLFMVVTLGVIAALLTLAWGVALPLSWWAALFGAFDAGAVGLLYQLVKSQRSEER